MEAIRNLDIEVVAGGLAGLVLVQLAVELSGIYRRARRASRDRAFLQVQARHPGREERPG